MLKKLLMVLALGLMGSTAFAQSFTANFTYLYDVDSSGLTYCVMTGQNSDPFAVARVGTSNIKTTGTSTTLTEFTSGALPFTNLSVGDTIVVPKDNSAVPTQQTVMITAKASGASITVSGSGLTLTGTLGHPFNWLKQTCGTAITDGWATVSGHKTVLMTSQYEQGDLDGLRVRWECKASGVGAQPVIVYPGESSDCGIGGTLSTDRCNFATAGVTARLSVLVEENPFAYCRVGLAYAATDTSDATTNLEQVTVTLTKVK
jgi:hypothetical protein